MAYYNDGSSTPTNTFNKGTLSSTATVRPGWANWYANHNGNIDDSLFDLINNAQSDLNFEAPLHPEALTIEGEKLTKFSYMMYTTKNVINTLKAFLRKSDDQFGYRPDVYGTDPSLNGVPMIRCQPLETAKLAVYGTDPIYLINHNFLYPVLLRGFDFKISKGDDKDRHLQGCVFLDTVWQIFCENSPRYSGALISQHPT